MSKILITGGAGFIGYHLAKKLVLGENEVVLANNHREKKDEDLEILLANPKVKMIEGDLTEKSLWEKIGNGYDYVYHLTGLKSFKDFSEIPHEVLRIGIESTLNLLNWFRSKNAKPSAKILYTSSSEAYAGIPDTYNPRWTYAGQKLIGEMLFIHYAKAYNLRMVIVRPNNVYGPRAGEDSMIPKFIAKTQKKTDPFPLINPDEKRTSCYVGDLVEALILAVESKKTDGGTYYVAGSRTTTVEELLEIIFNLMNWHPRKIDVKKVPEDPYLASLPTSDKIKEDTGWTPKTSLEEGLRMTVEWYTKTNQ